MCDLKSPQCEIVDTVGFTNHGHTPRCRWPQVGRKPVGAPEPRQENPAREAKTQAGPGPSSLPAGFLPLPVVDGATLTYERFLREYALPRQPCLITNLGPSWRAREWNAEYLLAHEGVDQTHRVHMADGPPQEAKERQHCIRATASRLLAAEPSLLCVSRRTTVGKALEAVRRAGGRPVYLSAWDYVRGNSGALAS